MKRSFPTAGLVLVVLVSCLGTTTPARAHHVMGRPHFVVDERYPDPIMTLKEHVGPWVCQVEHSPGNPVAGSDSRFRVQVSCPQGSAPIGKFSVRVQRLHLLAAGTFVFSADMAPDADGNATVLICYPADGNYVVSFSLGDAERPGRLTFPVVVGMPGAPGVTIVGFIASVFALVITVRAIRIKRERRQAGAP